MLNKVLLIGRIGQDPEKRVTPNGATVVNLSLATSEKWTDKAGQKQEKTEWHRITFWNKQADIIEQYVHKGDLLYVEGSLETKEYEKNGERRFSTEINGREFKFFPKSGGGEQSDRQPQEKSPATNYGNTSGEDFQESDIPF